MVLAIVGVLAAWYSQREAHGPATPSAAQPPPIREETREREKPVAPRAADFDFYLMTLGSLAAFCADGHARLPECSADARRPLVIHGLWPERLAPGAYPHDCAAPPLALD